MTTVSEVKEQVVARFFGEVLTLFVKATPKKLFEDFLQEWCGCSVCNKTIAIGERVFWKGGGFVHRRCIEKTSAVPWDKVTFEDYEGSVTERLEQRKELLVTV
jgi:hypothetical protein